MKWSFQNDGKLAAMFWENCIFKLNPFFSTVPSEQPLFHFCSKVWRSWKGIEGVLVLHSDCPSVTSWCKGWECHHWWWSINIQQPPRLNGPSTTVSTCLLIHFSGSNCSTWQNFTLRDKQNYLYNIYPACIIFYPPSEWQMQLAVMGKLWSHPASHPGPSPS